MVLGSGAESGEREGESVPLSVFWEIVLCCSGMAMMCACVSKGIVRLYYAQFIRGVNWSE